MKLQLAQSYETLIVDPETGIGNYVVVLPPALIERYGPTTDMAVAAIRPSVLDKMEDPSEVVYALSVLHTGAEDFQAHFRGEVAFSLDPELLRFTEGFFQGGRLPVESSPLAGKALAALFGAAGGGITLAYAALVAGQPAVILVGAAGIIVVSVASALGVGLGYKILQRLGVPLSGTSDEEADD